MKQLPEVVVLDAGFGTQRYVLVCHFSVGYSDGLDFHFRVETYDHLFFGKVAGQHRQRTGTDHGVP
jgi:hypothetical protein